MLNAALSRLEAAIGAAQSQEAKVASLMKQVRACAMLSTHHGVHDVRNDFSAVPQLVAWRRARRPGWPICKAGKGG